MKRNLSSVTVLLLIVINGLQAASAQIRINMMDSGEAIADRIAGPKREVAKNAVFYSASDDDPILRHFLDEIEKHRVRIEAHDYKIHRGLFPSGSRKYVFYAISKKERDKWLKTFDDQTAKNKLSSALDGLAKAIAGRLPKYFPHKKNFAYRNPREEKMMMAALKKRISVKKLHMIGIRDRIWQIKTNEFGIPKERFKEGFIWVQNAADDHPYCRVYQVDLIQKYAGGGTYGSKFAFVLGSDLYAC